MDDRAGFMTDDMHTKNTVGPGIGQDFHETVGMTLGLSLIHI